MSWTLSPCSSGGAVLNRGGGLHDHPQPHLQIIPVEEARWISAAPDMLAILKEIVAAGSPSPYANASFEKRMTRARLVIAKAEGK